MSSPGLLHMKFPRCVLERISMKYDRNLGAFGTKERNEIWAEGYAETVLGLGKKRRVPAGGQSIGLLRVVH